MTDHNTGMVYFIEHYSAYLIAALGVMWAMMVWAFRSVIGRYNFATVHMVRAEIQSCKAEVDKKDEALEDQIRRLDERNTSQHERIEQLLIQHLDK